MLTPTATEEHRLADKKRQQRLRVKDRRRWMLSRLWSVVDRVELGLAELMKIRMVFVFGSTARGAAQPNDLDLLVVWECTDEWREFRDSSWADFPEEAIWRGIVGRTDYVDLVLVRIEELQKRLLGFERWPDPILVWIDGKRVGSLWTEEEGGRYREVDSCAVELQGALDELGSLRRANDKLQGGVTR